MEQLTTAVEWISRHSKHKRANDAAMKLALAATVYHICLEGYSRTLIAKLEASIDSLVPDFSVLPVNRSCNLRTLMPRGSSRRLIKIRGKL